MSGIHNKALAAKRRIIEEARAFLLLFIYLFVFLGAFGWYKRLILFEHHYDFLHYGYTVVEAAVLAKLMLVGNAMGFFKRLHKSPLIVAGVCQTLVFSLGVIFFSLEEETVIGLIHGRGLSWGFDKLMQTSWIQVLVDFIVIFICFMPLFSIWELARVLGPEQLASMFFKKRPPAGVPLMTAAAPGKAASKRKGA